MSSKPLEPKEKSAPNSTADSPVTSENTPEMVARRGKMMLDGFNERIAEIARKKQGLPERLM